MRRENDVVYNYYTRIFRYMFYVCAYCFTIVSLYLMFYIYLFNFQINIYVNYCYQKIVTDFMDGTFEMYMPIS